MSTLRFAARKLLSGRVVLKEGERRLFPRIRRLSSSEEVSSRQVEKKKELVHLIRLMGADKGWHNEGVLRARANP